MVSPSFKALFLNIYLCPLVYCNADSLAEYEQHFGEKLRQKTFRYGYGLHSSSSNAAFSKKETKEGKCEFIRISYIQRLGWEGKHFRRSGCFTTRWKNSNNRLHHSFVWWVTWGNNKLFHIKILFSYTADIKYAFTSQYHQHQSIEYRRSKFSPVYYRVQLNYNTRQSMKNQKPFWILPIQYSRIFPLEKNKK